MSHFYRGEVTRIMAWRARLDSTTNWAITTTSTIVTVSFSIAHVPHIIFVFNIAVVTIMLWIEARRYRFYDAFRARVRMLEAHFLVPVILQHPAVLEGDWRKMLAEDLLMPGFKISRFEALGRRLKRNYVFIYIVILVAWLTKIFLHAEPVIHSWSSFYLALSIGTAIPGWLVAIFLFSTFAAVVSISYWAAVKLPGEFTDFGPRRKWQI
jgi:uncharacterized membrane protein